MQKKSKLAAALEGGKPETPIVLKAADKKRSDRTGKKCLATWIPEEMFYQFKSLSVDQRTTLERITMIAINDYFAKHNKPQIIIKNE